MNPPSDIKELFAYWVEERGRIRQRKEAGSPKPWSGDPVFQTTYFCNVDREHDKVTRWIREAHNIPIKNSAEMTTLVEGAAWSLTLARMVNKVESLTPLWWPWNPIPTNWKSMFHEVMSQPGAWGSAYIVSTNGRRQPKHEYIAGLLEQALEQLYGPPATVLGGTLKSAYTRLQAVSGLGSFMAAQVVADLKNTKRHPLYDAPDWYEFSAPGPGSLRGLSRFHEKRITPKSYPEAIASARRWLYSNGYRQQFADLCNQNLQNCFCEFDKYVRVRNGEGRSKRRYNGSA